MRGLPPSKPVVKNENMFPDWEIDFKVTGGRQDGADQVGTRHGLRRAELISIGGVVCSGLVTVGEPCRDASGDDHFWCFLWFLGNRLNTGVSSTCTPSSGTSFGRRYCCRRSAAVDQDLRTVSVLSSRKIRRNMDSSSAGRRTLTSLATAVREHHDSGNRKDMVWIAATFVEAIRL